MMNYEYDKENSIIHLRASGILVVDDPIKYFYSLRDEWTSQLPAQEYVYFMDLDDIQFSYSDILAIKDAFIKSGHESRVSKVKFITDSDYSFGMARMVISIFGDVFKTVEIERRDS